MRIIECIDKDGIHSTRYEYTRQSRPHVGDLIQVSDKKFWLIQRIEEDGSLSVCEDWYSDGGFISWNKEKREAVLSVSGGPFRALLPLDVEPTLGVHDVTFWNWGDAGAGAGQGCSFRVARPVFRLIQIEAHGYDIRKLCDQWNIRFMQNPTSERLNIKSLRWTKKDIQDVCDAIGDREKYARLTK